MIFGGCPYCNEPFSYPYESGDEPVGAFDRQKCQKCGRYMFIERRSFESRTLSEEKFWEEFPGAKKME